MILVPVYYQCPMLCNQVLNGLTRTLKPLSIDAGKDFDVVAVQHQSVGNARAGGQEEGRLP